MKTNSVEVQDEYTWWMFLKFVYFLSLSIWHEYKSFFVGNVALKQLMWVFRCMLSRVTGPCFNPVGPAVLISWLWLLTAFEPSYFQTGNHATFWYSAPKVLYYFLPFKPRHSAFQYQQSPKYPLIFWIIFCVWVLFFQPCPACYARAEQPFFHHLGQFELSSTVHSASF